MMKSVCLRRWMAGGVVITAGFGESSEAHGKELQQALLEVAKPYLLRIIGPNCLGILVPGIGLNASFAHLGPAKDRLAFVAQSGAIVTSVIDWAERRRTGFSHLVSFMSAARAAARMKSTIAVKAGRHAEGARAPRPRTPGRWPGLMRSTRPCSAAPVCCGSIASSSSLRRSRSWPWLLLPGVRGSRFSPMAREMALVLSERGIPGKTEIYGVVCINADPDNEHAPNTPSWCGAI
jgi:hypothetical protein